MEMGWARLVTMGPITHMPTKVIWTEMESATFVIDVPTL
jgi:hypothetical protein